MAWSYCTAMIDWSPVQVRKGLSWGIGSFAVTCGLKICDCINQGSRHSHEKHVSAARHALSGSRRMEHDSDVCKAPVNKTGTRVITKRAEFNPQSLKQSLLTTLFHPRFVSSASLFLTICSFKLISSTEVAVAAWWPTAPATTRSRCSCSASGHDSMADAAEISAFSLW